MRTLKGVAVDSQSMSTKGSGSALDGHSLTVRGQALQVSHAWPWFVPSPCPLCLYKVAVLSTICLQPQELQQATEGHTWCHSWHRCS